MPVAHQAAAARLGLEIGMSMQEITDLRLNGLCQQGTCPAAQNLGERIREGPWLRKLENVTVDHGVSLLRWRSGGVEHPHDTPPYPLMPSPTFALSSSNLAHRRREGQKGAACDWCRPRAFRAARKGASGLAISNR